MNSLSDQIVAGMSFHLFVIHCYTIYHCMRPKHSDCRFLFACVVFLCRSYCNIECYCSADNRQFESSYCSIANLNDAACGGIIVCAAVRRYWCSSNNPRGSLGQHNIDPPGGFIYGDVLPQAARYANPKGAIFHARGGSMPYFSCVVLLPFGVEHTSPQTSDRVLILPTLHHPCCFIPAHSASNGPCTMLTLNTMHYANSTTIRHTLRQLSACIIDDDWHYEVHRT